MIQWLERMYDEALKLKRGQRYPTNKVSETRMTVKLTKTNYVTTLYTT